MVCTRPLSSTFHLPFQAYPANPDPGTIIPSMRFRSSLSSADSHAYTDLSRPNSPFMVQAISRSSSTHSFRAPFRVLPPPSRPASPLWSPPTYLFHFQSSTPNDSTTALLLQPLKSSTPLSSTHLNQKLDENDKQWINHPDRTARLSWWLTFTCLILGFIGAAFLCYLGLMEGQKLTEDQLCLIMSDDFSSSSSSSLDESIWSPQVELGGFGNGDFEMTTDNLTNLRIVDGELYLTPTITTEDFPGFDIFNGGNYTLEGCTEPTNPSACSVRTNPSTGTISILYVARGSIPKAKKKSNTVESTFVQNFLWGTSSLN
jgi:hypothetical protein